MSRPTVTIIDYGMGNLGSLRRSLEECGAASVISENAIDLRQADWIILPGVGAFGDGMAHLKERGWLPEIDAAVHERKVPLLGICLGMQLLAQKGYESGEMPGLGLIPGEIPKLIPENPAIRIPHVGWNEVAFSRADPLFDGIPSHTDFYFVHSYHFTPTHPEHILATTPYCGRFVSAVRSDNIAGVQFHPEKSQKPGMQLLKNFLAYTSVTHA